MMGDNGKAECSICMDDVSIGDKVTYLPCTHWFHRPCIEAWLREHDTCPHCRKGISADAGSSSNNGGNNGGSSSNAPSHGDWSQRQPEGDGRRAQSEQPSAPPGAWVEGSSSTNNRYVVGRGSPTHERRPSAQTRYSHPGGADRSGRADGSSPDNGIGGTLRSLFRNTRGSERPS
jgi:E3 ubiquitin-protein ligase RNF115/126